MRVELHNSGDKLVIAPQDERLDAASSASFKGQILDAINRGNMRLVLDLEKVNFIDSSGLTAIVSTLKSLGGEGSMVVCGLGPNTSSLFRLTRLDKIIKVFPNQSAALTA